MATSIGLQVIPENNRGRMTGPSSSERFRDAMLTVGQSAISGVAGLASILPGGGVASAALRSTSSAATNANAETGDPAVDSLVRAQSDDNLRYLQLQMNISAENQRFTTVSNVLHARHETAKNAISNIR